jgi:hypothetical protein
MLAFCRFELFGIIHTSSDTIDSPASSIQPVIVSHSSTVVVDGIRTEIAMNSVRPLAGIVSHLCRKHGGNIHEKGIVTIASSSVYRDEPRYSAKNLAAMSSRLIFSSKNEPNQWVRWDFHDIRVVLTRYSIQTHASLRNGAHLKSWVIDGSIDGLRWTEFDRQANNDNLNERLAVRSFSVSASSECRFVRLLQTGMNHQSNNMLTFAHFELFGFICTSP